MITWTRNKELGDGGVGLSTKNGGADDRGEGGGVAKGWGVAVGVCMVGTMVIFYKKKGYQNHNQDRKTVP